MIQGMKAAGLKDQGKTMERIVVFYLDKKKFGFDFGESKSGFDPDKGVGC